MGPLDLSPEDMARAFADPEALTLMFQFMARVLKLRIEALDKQIATLNSVPQADMKDAN
jgi:hypothetical protein